jgi:hypothetical protein
MTANSCRLHRRGALHELRSNYIRVVPTFYAFSSLHECHIRTPIQTEYCTLYYLCTFCFFLYFMFFVREVVSYSMERVKYHAALAV